MSPADVLDVGRDALWVLLVVSSPIMGIALGVGLGIALLQALTQVQEMTLVFVPKIVAIFVSILVLMPFMGMTLGGFMMRIADQISRL